MNVYDEEMAVKSIQNFLPQDLKDKFPEDTLYYMLDVICEFYDAQDWLSEEEDEEDEEKEKQELVQFIIMQSEKDGIGQFTEDEIRVVLAAENAYCDTLDWSE